MTEPTVPGGGEAPAWNVETGGAQHRQELPFAIDVIGDFRCAAADAAGPLADRPFAEVTAENFAATLSEWRPALDIPRPLAGSAPAPPATIRLEFTALDDFAAEALERRVRDALAEAGAGDAEHVDAVLANEALRELEGSLRALDDLARRVSRAGRARLRVLPVTKAELAASFQERGDPGQSVLFRKVYEERYGMFGGEPCSLLLADYRFGHLAGDLRLLGNLARLAEAAMCPVVVGASAALLERPSWRDLAARGLPPVAFASRAHAGWRALRESVGARHVIATLPRIRSMDGNGLINGGYAVAARLIETFAATRGVNLGGEFGDLGSAEVEFPDDLNDALAGCGLLPVGQRGAVEPGRLRTLERPKRYFDAEKSERAAAAANLVCVLWTLQFGRAVKCIARDGIGAFADDDALQAALDAWLQGYVDPRGNEGGSRLLAEARVTVSNPAGLRHDSGERTVVLELRPALSGAAFSRAVSYEITVVGSPVF